MSNLAGTGTEPEPDSLEAFGDEELVDQFLNEAKRDRAHAHRCFEVIIARYRGLIHHIVRNSHYRFPEWDSADDVVARVIFKVYRGLVQWRRQGKLSSFIARIASSELIDTIRRVVRDKSWNPRAPADPDSDEPSAVDLAVAKTPSPEAEAIHREQRAMVDRLLADVCRDWKDTVIVSEYIIGHRNAKEISEKYDMSEDLVYQRARRLRVRLEKWLRERGITSAATLLGGGPSAKKT